MKDTTTVRKRSRAKPVEVAKLVPVLPDALAAMDIETPASRHRARMARYGIKRPVVDDAHKATFIALMREGELPTDICDDIERPPMSAFVAAMKADVEFAEAYAEAFPIMADMALQDAWRYARDAAGTGNVDAARMADSYAKTIAYMLEKLSPKSYGVLVKHAGSEGGNINVSVVSYATKPAALVQTP